MIYLGLILYYVVVLGFGIWMVSKPAPTSPNTVEFPKYVEYRDKNGKWVSAYVDGAVLGPNGQQIRDMDGTPQYLTLRWTGNAAEI